MVLKSGSGEKRAEPQDSVRIEYAGWSPDGKCFGSSEALGRAARVGIASVIPALREAILDMAEGEKRRLWIPANPGINKAWPEPPDGPIVMEVELLEIISGPKPIVVPPDVAAPPADASKTRSGLASKVLKSGTGKEHPKASDTVRVHYSGWTTDGKMFDSSVAKGKPAVFPLDAVIAGWTEGVQLMTEGETRRLWIPEKLAYKGVAGRPQGMLVFDIELLEIVRPPKAPADVAKPPADGEKTASGLVTKVLRPGKGKEHPSASDYVSVEYSGWTTDGKCFDTSVTRGQPQNFRLTDVIEGWREGLQLMVEGEKRRLWIPQDLAYKGKRGKPKGMLVFDVELLEIRR